jgi:hypothetical protein
MKRSLLYMVAFWLILSFGENMLFSKSKSKSTVKFFAPGGLYVYMMEHKEKQKNLCNLCNPWFIFIVVEIQRYFLYNWVLKKNENLRSICSRE